MAEIGHAQGHADWPLTVRRTSDGAIVATLPVQGRFLALTDSGIVYLAVGPEWKLRVDALRISAGTRLWRAERRDPLRAPRMVVPFLSFATESSLYFARLKQPRYLAEALAFDVRSGRQRWRWHSPAHLASLITLWGWRTPQVIGFALSQGRQSITRAREHQRQRGSLAGEVVREIVHGQWRRPTRLLGHPFSAAAGPGESADDERLYLGTSMGLFALDGRSGRRLWHALPTMEIASIVPAPGQRLSGHTLGH